jgi:hypothetical protein
MTKAQFIKEAKALGYSKYKEFVIALGYHERTLDRYKQDEEISKKITQAVNEFKGGSVKVDAQKTTQKKNTTQKTQHKKHNTKNTTQKEKCVKKETQEKVVEDKKEEIETHIHTQDVEQENTRQPIEKTHTIGIDISNEDYHASNRMSVSKLKVLIDNAKEFESKYIKKEIEQKDTDALIVGKLHHTLVMEPHKFNDEYTIIDLPSRPVKDDLVDALEKLGGEVDLKENGRGEIVVADTVEQLKAKIDAIKGTTQKTVCTKAQYDLAKETAQKALDSWFEIVHGGKTLLKAQLKQLLELDKCYVEKTFYGVIDGVDVQVRPDILINLGAKHDVWFVIDLKTLEVATPAMFVKQGGAFYWHMQEQFYLEVLRQNGINPKAFYFNCAGKKEFSGAGFFEWGATTKDEAKKVLKAGFRKYKYCVENNIFLEASFDYQNLKFQPITTLEVPAYVMHQFGDMGV